MFSNRNLDKKIKELEVFYLFLTFWARAKWVGSYLTGWTEPFSLKVGSYKALVAKDFQSRYFILALRTIQRDLLTRAS